MQKAVSSMIIRRLALHGQPDLINKLNEVPFQRPRRYRIQIRLQLRQARRPQGNRVAGRLREHGVVDGPAERHGVAVEARGVGGVGDPLRGREEGGFQVCLLVGHAEAGLEWGGCVSGAGFSGAARGTLMEGGRVDVGKGRGKEKEKGGRTEASQREPGTFVDSGVTLPENRPAALGLASAVKVSVGRCGKPQIKLQCKPAWSSFSDRIDSAGGETTVEERTEYMAVLGSISRTCKRKMRCHASAARETSPSRPLG
jgi:hypothetical protein